MNLDWHIYIVAAADMLRKSITTCIFKTRLAHEIRNWTAASAAAVNRSRTQNLGCFH